MKDQEDTPVVEIFLIKKKSTKAEKCVVLLFIFK
jgi:hypothetical protein